MLDEKQQRAQLVAAARLWLGTPYRHMQRVKGHGADCAMFPLGVYADGGLIPRLTVEGDPGVTTPDIAYYPMDWHLHRDAERYLDIVHRLAREVTVPPERTPEPGDFCVAKFGRAFAHGLIVLEWPLCIHSHLNHGVVYVDAEQDPQLIGREMKVFSLWPEAA